jgi:hypothetical protein
MPQLPFDEDEFALWRDHPITRHVLDVFLGGEATRAKTYWLDAAWNGRLEPLFHAACRERVDLINQIAALSFEDLADDRQQSEPIPHQ